LGLPSDSYLFTNVFFKNCAKRKHYSGFASACLNIDFESGDGRHAVSRQGYTLDGAHDLILRFSPAKKVYPVNIGVNIEKEVGFKRLNAGHNILTDGIATGDVDGKASAKPPVTVFI
jgi:hypothetical protein